MSVDVQSVVLQIEVISISSTLLLIKNKPGFVSWLYFPTLMPTQVAFIFMLLSPVSKERRGKGYLFPPLFLHLSPNKNTLNPF